MYSWQNMDYGKAGNLAHERNPRIYGWGYFAGDTLPDSGVGLFFWFESPSELLAFIADIETQALKDKNKIKKVREVIKGFGKNKRLTEDLRKQINSQLSDIEIKWWGRFSDLCKGKGKFSKQLIKSYFGPLFNPDKPQTVYTPKFIEFCQNWGH